MSLVLFAHGKESGPWGTKSLALAAVARRLGWRFLSPDLSSTPDAEARIALFLAALPAEPGTLVLIGSSMGGYVATCASAQIRPAGLLLLAPAFYLPGYHNQDPHPWAGRTVVVHGREDDLVPPEHAWRFAERHRAEFHLLADGHPLTGSVPFLEALLARMLRDLTPGIPFAAHL